MKNIIITLAQKEDAPFIAENNEFLAFETEGKTLSRDVTLAGIISVLDKPYHGFYLVAEQDDIHLGSLMITYEYSDWRDYNMWWIQSVYVRKEFRGKGIYSKLYEEVRKRATEKGVGDIRLCVETENVKAQNVYEKLGMKRMSYFMYHAKP